MPRTEESNQRIREEQSRRIILAATKVFAHKGLVATKMSDIATEAGISYGLLYHYFDSKETIFRAALERTALRGFEELIQRIGALPLTPWERIFQLTTIMLAGLQSEPESYLISQQAIMNETLPQEIRERAIQSWLRGIEEFKQLLIEGQSAGQVVAGDPDELATLYFACIGGTAMGFIQYDFLPSNYPKPETLLRLLKA